jgi:hypothetical protein
MVGLRESSAYHGLEYQAVAPDPECQGTQQPQMFACP